MLIGSNIKDGVIRKLQEKREPINQIMFKSLQTIRTLFIRGRNLLCQIQIINIYSSSYGYDLFITSTEFHVLELVRLSLVSYY